MKAILVLAVLLAVASAVPFHTKVYEDQAKAQFADFMIQYEKVYATAEEFDQRYANFKASLARVAAMEPSTAVFGVTKFSDLSEEEFKNTMLMPSRPQRTFEAVPELPVNESAAPSTWDWRTKGAVTPVKDQGQCGSCWAFSATEAIESAWILKGHATANSINLSPQQIVDCDTIDGVQGCNGGYTESAYDYIKQAGGQDPIADYPYTAQNGQCKFKAADVISKISGYSTVSKTESLLSNTLSTTGPLSICLDAAKWQDYQSGVMTNTQCCPALKCELDHCVQLVGYDSTASVPYWIVRNSWNTNWGIAGYIYLEMNKNTCGITTDITWPTSE